MKRQRERGGGGGGGIGGKVNHCLLLAEVRRVWIGFLLHCYHGTFMDVQIHLAVVIIYDGTVSVLLQDIDPPL